ncbi:MAG: RsmF rRNA methyltransferase first C-terminal domain-containing protein [Streptococcaceae bacterium]|jgi:16S rRNA C967 or C1407 C5-methylase (RsmB/RsmF family)/NOL1/NOP2/fmu family ribosome biogenesis protein|nr:RsmF rRNA methyltransferase first C-terminal domain-containing protein [Streptococcaceae bacterium]
MELPKDFKEKYQFILKDEFQAFISSFDEPAVSGFRLNPFKIGSTQAEKILESKFGYYGKISGHSAAFLTGLAYSQEPAAQMVGEMAHPEAGMRVLDLCAAPGGKSTHLLSFLGESGLLVSNEISSKRAKVLVENMERWGSRNTVILNESPQKLAKTFPEYFDLIVVDAPCSGEGMFRKDPDAVQYWSQDYVRECAERQREILTEAVKMLAPGGKLVYSTCTWSPEEDEAQVEWLLREYPDFERQQEQKFWPHKFRGEGQFVSVLKDSRARVIPVKQGKSAKASKNSLTIEQRKLWQQFAEESLSVQLDGNLQLFADNLYILPKDLPDLSKLKIARNGLHLGVFKKNRFEPSYALGMALSASETVNHVELDELQFRAYLAGNTVKVEERLKNGWYQLLVQGNGLGFAKLVDSTVKNYYPKGLRRYD